MTVSSAPPVVVPLLTNTAEIMNLLFFAICATLLALTSSTPGVNWSLHPPGGASVTRMTSLTQFSRNCPNAGGGDTIQPELTNPLTTSLSASSEASGSPFPPAPISALTATPTGPAVLEVAISG